MVADYPLQVRTLCAIANIKRCRQKTHTGTEPNGTYISTCPHPRPWYGLLTTAKTPPAIVDKLYREVIRIMQLPEAKERMANVGFEIVGSTPAEFAKLIREEIPKWTKIVREGKIRAE